MTMNFEPVLGKNPEVVNVSNSEISTYRDCKRRWWLAYYLGLKPKAVKVEGALALGTRVHYALEMYYTDHADPIEVYKKSVNDDRVWLLAEGRETEKFDKEAELGRIMLEGYLEWLEETGADSGFDVVSAEEKLSVPILDGKVKLIGKLDMRIKRKMDGVRLFMDHKTAASFDSVSKISHMNWQVKMYLLLEMLKENETERCDGAIYNVLKKVRRTAAAKPPFYERIEVRHNKATMHAFWLQVHGVIQEMLATRSQLDGGYDHQLVAPPRPTNDCSWKCEFFAACPMFDDGSAVDELIDDFYTQGNPYERYEERTDA